MHILMQKRKQCQVESFPPNSLEKPRYKDALCVAAIHLFPLPHSVSSLLNTQAPSGYILLNIPQLQPAFSKAPPQKKAGEYAPRLFEPARQTIAKSVDPRSAT